MISSKQISMAVVSLVKEKKDAEHVLEKLMTFVKKHKLENYLPQILENLRKESLKQKVKETLFVETPFDESKESLSKIQNYISVSGNSPVSHKVNKNILGGFRAYYKDKKFDGSLENVLKKLEQKLKEN
jgi:F0F1-type ATP synthase delta subunit